MNPLLMTSQDPTDSRNVSSSCRNCAIFSCFDGIMEIGLLLQPSKHTAWKRQRPPPSPSRSDSPMALSSSHLSPHVVFNPPTHSEIKANLNIDLKRKVLLFCNESSSPQRFPPPHQPHVFNATKWQTCAWCSSPRPTKTADSAIWRQKMSDELETKLTSAKIPGFALLMTFLCVNA